MNRIVSGSSLGYLWRTSGLARWFLRSPGAISPSHESLISRWCERQLSNMAVALGGVRPEVLTGLATWCLAGLLFSCIFIPRIQLMLVASSYRVDLRVEDLILGLLILLFCIAATQRQGALKAKVIGAGIGTECPQVPAVEKAFLFFLLACEVSVLNGLVFRTIDKPLLSFFYVLKWVEYFLIFFVTVRLSANRRASSFLLGAFFLLGIAVTSYGYWEHFFPAAKAVYPNYYRLFERAPFRGDANHMGGFLVLWMGFFTGLYLRSKDRRNSVFLFFALVFAYFPLIWTYSRKSYFALMGALLFAFLSNGSRRRWFFLVSTLVLLGMWLPTRLAERLTDLGEVLGAVDPFRSSWAGNWVMWKEAFWNFERFALFGCGLGARHRLMYESQYVLVLTETGLVGFFGFLYLGLTLAREALAGMRRSHAANDRAWAWGWLIGWTGLIIHNASCVSWTVSKIAIPFWVLTALVMNRLRLHRIEGHAG